MNEKKHTKTVLGHFLGKTHAVQNGHIKCTLAQKERIGWRGIVGYFMSNKKTKHWRDNIKVNVHCTLFNKARKKAFLKGNSRYIQRRATFLSHGRLKKIQILF